MHSIPDIMDMTIAVPGDSSLADDYEGVRTIDHDALSETAFERIINAKRDFCLFLRDLLVQDEHVLIPPENGWPEITTEAFALLGKSDAVVNVQRHLVYISGNTDSYTHQIMPEISLIDYRDAHVIKNISSNNVQQIKNESRGYENEVEPDVIGLASSSEDVALPLLNCVSGLIGHRDDHMVVPVEEYFDGIKQKFIRMEQLPEGVL